MNSFRTTDTAATLTIPFDWLNSFPLPLLLVDKTFTLIYSNENARSLIDELSNSCTLFSEDGRNGVKMRCAMAGDKPGICRDDCEVRRAIRATLDTQKPIYNLELGRQQTLSGGAIDTQPVNCATFFVDLPATPAVMIALGSETKVQRLQSLIMLLESDGLAGHLADSVFHDIATPLSYTIANLEFVSEQLQQMRSQLGAEVYDPIEAPVEDALMGIRAMKKSAELYNLSRQTQHQTLSGFSLSELVDVAIKMLPSDTTNTAAIRFHRDDSVWVKACSRETIHAIYELLENAGESFLERAAGRNFVEITVSESAHWAHLDIQDNGRGIPQGDIANVFSPTFTTKKANAGFGFGLMFCRNVISSIGGEMKIRSTPGAGTTVSIFFTKSQRPAISSPPVSISALPPALVESTILFISPEIMLRRLARRMLTGFGVISCPPDAVAIQDAMDHQSFDLIICDVVPGEDAGLFVARIMERSVPGRIPVVYLTGPSAVFPQLAATGDQREFTLAKPFDSQQLRETVCVALRQSGDDRLISLPIIRPPDGVTER